MNNKYTSKYLLAFILLIADILALFFTLELASYIRSNFSTDIFPHLQESTFLEYYWVVFILLIMLVLEKIYILRYDFFEEMKRVYKAVIFSFLAVFTMLTLTKMSDEYSRSFIILFFALALLSIPFFKRFTKKFLFKSEYFKIPIHIVAKGSQKELLIKEIEDNWYFGSVNSESDYSMVLISSKSFDVSELPNIIKEYSAKTKDIYVIPYMDHLDFSHASIMNYSNIKVSAIHLENRLLNSQNTFVKYLTEKILVVSIFPFALFLHLFISFFIKLDSQGSVIFKQKRLGKDAKHFSCYKYRTMYSDGDSLLKEYLMKNPEEIAYYDNFHKYKNDPRITKVGNFLRKSSLDEFPQFYNILQGKMNLIGPRPYMLSEATKIGEENLEIILKVKPGITGLWQVSGRSELSFSQRIHLDSWYINNWSLWLDFTILLKTLKVVFMRVGSK